MDKKNKIEELIQNLHDAGGNIEIVNEFSKLLGERKMDKIFILLSRYRSSLLESLHQNQKEIDILDYLILDLKKQNL